MASVTQSQRDKLTELYKRKLNKLEQAIFVAKGLEIKAIEERSRDLAAESLGIKDLFVQAVEKIAIITNYREEVKMLQEKMDEVLQKPDSFYSRRYYGNSVGEMPLSAFASEQVAIREQHHKRILLSETSFGSKLNQIEEIKENMEEQVMRATSTKEIQSVMDDFDEAFKELKLGTFD